MPKPLEIEEAGRALDEAFKALQQGALLAAGDWLALAKPTSHAHQLRLKLLQGLLLLQQHQLKTGLLLALPALHQSEAEQRHLDLAWAFALVGFRLGFSGDPERGLSYLGKAQALNTELDLTCTHIHYWRGCLHGMAGRYEDAMVSFEDALNLARAFGAVREEAGIQNSLALTHLKQAEASERRGDSAGAFHQASTGLTHALRGLAVIANLPSESKRPYLLRQQAHALALMGKPEAAIPILQGLQNEPQELPVRISVLCTLARVERQAKAFTAARQLLDQAIELATVHGDNFDLDGPLRDAIDTEEEAGNWQAALACARRHSDYLERSYRERLQAVALHTETVAESARLQQANLDLQRSERYWQDQALRDGLTGLCNRVGLNGASSRLWAIAQDFGTAIVDVDHFKRVNDNLGHAMGDAVLCELGRLLLQACRQGDVVARIGGEEFVLLLPHLSEAEALRTCQRLRELVQLHTWNELHPELNVTISVGLAMRHDAEAWQTQLERADRALYQAKREGRNRVQLASCCSEP